ncbi:hypothetical protein AJGP001_10790 [Planococcus faecalis]|uniref:Uncharacterized protein n=1 Tax=Planococcus faecalis TaxID=1598147 RepID=A0ABM6IT03_9BACL|nr:hypothetical protein [Planococcus faecalis]AQU79720.1 hypothetical protein AJGP001_10790 [Planococcus faecalis]
MDPLLELDILTNYIQPFTPIDTAIELLNLPEQPYNGMLVFRFLEEELRMINGWQSEHVRRWQVLYFHEHTAKVVQISTRIAKAFIHGITIPYKDEESSMWFTRIRAYSVGQPQETESGKGYILSILETKTGEVRTQEQYARMEQYLINLTVPVLMQDLTFGQVEGAEFNTLDAMKLPEETI